eukprot:CAMPEP_0197525312 /NCGR_PEP_ID=MMETSP1318-20131121/10836_1 /TAXON_ID=552666 /ORGANISM="Partenskyella glossopodia, Strain RCC365" /LENGTH=267 /DNA_ID=CAMNT_0043078539 /DNA_START=52 /DNA_END=852 /DNA_ORIENTATION=+
MSEKETPKPAEAVAEPKNEDKPEGGEPETAAEAKEGAQAEGGEESKDMENYDKMIAGWQKKLKETEEEISKIEAMSSEYEAQVSSGGKTSMVSNGPDVDKRSIYVGNVEYETTPDELKEFFTPCGVVNRVTIMCNKRTGRPMGYAYVEFKEEDAVTNAVLLDKQEFKGRPLKISAKRTNMPGFGGVAADGQGIGEDVEAMATAQDTTRLGTNEEFTDLIRDESVLRRLRVYLCVFRFGSLEACAAALIFAVKAMAFFYSFLFLHVRA